MEWMQYLFYVYYETRMLVLVCHIFTELYL